MNVAIISDLHSNWIAVQRVFQDIDRCKVDVILVAGDVIGYYFQPSEVVDLLRFDKRVHVIRGNHEEILLRCMQDDVYRAHIKDTYGVGHEICLDALSTQQLDWIASLPDHIELEIDKLSFGIWHGSISSAWDYIYPDAPLATFAKNSTNKDFSIFGNTHYPMIYANEGRYQINPGSVGQPRDVGNLASYFLVNTITGTIQPKRVQFPTNKLISMDECLNPRISYLRESLRRNVRH